MIAGVTTQQQQMFKEAFALFDKDGSGSISTGEIGNIMKQLGAEPTPQELQEMIEEVDADGNGEVDFNEFVQLMAKRMREEDTTEELKNAFKALDIDKDGLLSREDLRTAMIKLGGQPLTDMELDELFIQADLDKDGKFDYDEFVRWVSPK